jgi:hypothetical protein
LEERARGRVSTGNLTKLDEMMPQVRRKGTSGHGGGTRAMMSTGGRYSVLTTYRLCEFGGWGGFPRWWAGRTFGPSGEAGWVFGRKNVIALAAALWTGGS